MKFSVIIPAYNAEKTIENTVKCIQKSGLYDFEIVIVNDGSKDGTPAICDRLAAAHDNIRCIHQENAGVSAARNRGLSEAKGDYVWFFDADDSVDENSMADAVRVVDEKSPDMLIFGMSFDYYNKGKLYRRDELVYDTEMTYTKSTLPSAFEKLFLCNATSAIWNKFIRKSVITSNGLIFNKSLFLMEDMLFSTMAMKACDSIYVLPQALYRYVQQTEKRESDEPGNKRLARIENLAEYLVPFEKALSDEPGVLVRLHFMLFSQKLRLQNPVEIKKTSEAFFASKYSKDYLISFCTESEKRLVSMLKRKKYLKVYLRNLKSRLRHRIAVFVKSTRIYSKIKGRYI